MGMDYILTLLPFSIFFFFFFFFFFFYYYSSDIHKYWHIDGFDKPNEIGSFTLLVGVLLEDVLNDFSGNLMVFPESPSQLGSYFNNSSDDSILKGGEERLPVQKVTLNYPTQIKGRKGDVVIANYNTAHSIAPNCSPNIRKCIYFRIATKDTHKDIEYKLKKLRNPLIDIK